MSYCRWGPESDVYVYEHVHGGFQVHVGARRQVSDKPVPKPPEKWNMGTISAWMAEDRKWRDEAAWENITLEEAGEDFNLQTAGECADLLEQLRAKGFRVPQPAIDALRDEAAA